MERMVSVARHVAASFCVWSLLTLSGSAQNQSESFDKPIKETVIDLGLSPYYPAVRQNHGQLRCHYFQRFMVKELDWGQKGDDWISIASNDPAHLTPCSQEHNDDETLHREAQDEYFDAAKGNFVFLGAADCLDRGSPFRVFDVVSGKELFEDQRRLSPKGKIADISFAKSGANLVMRYPSVVAAECSLPQKKSECWKEILRSTGLGPQPMPKCIGYSGFNRSEGYGTDDQSDPSVVSFPVEVTIPEFKRRILPGPVTCWAAD